MIRLGLGIVIGVAVALLAIGGGVFGRREAAPLAASPPATKSKPTASQLTPSESAQLAEVIERVQRDYVDDVAHPALVDDALRGIVSGLDPYSSYLDAEEYADLRVSTAGTYAGIGIEVSTAERALRVVRPFRESAAAT
jgi:carboxyl-terminal processing protease